MREPVHVLTVGPSPELVGGMSTVIGQMLRLDLTTRYSLSALPMKQRAVACLFLEAELPPAEIAPLVDMTANAARVTLQPGPQTAGLCSSSRRRAALS